MLDCNMVIQLIALRTYVSVYLESITRQRKRSTALPMSVNQAICTSDYLAIMFAFLSLAILATLDVTWII